MAQPLEDIPARRAYIDLVKLSDRLMGEFADLFRAHGLTHAQFNVLRILIEGPSEGLPCQAIGAQLISRLPDVTRLLDRMERDGLVRRARSDADRRVVLTRLTPKGRRRCESLYPHVMALHRAQFAHLSEREVVALDEGLRAALQRP